MPPKKRRTLAEAMQEALGHPVPVERMIYDEEPPPGAIVMRPEYGNEHPMHKETRERHGKRIQPYYPGYKVRLPNGQHLFWNKHTPKAAIEKGLLTDQELIAWANEWTKPGGNRFAEMMYANKLWNVYGMWENPNLHPADDPNLSYSDRNHYFDWRKWSAEYAAFKKG